MKRVFLGGGSIMETQKRLRSRRLRGQTLAKECIAILSCDLEASLAKNAAFAFALLSPLRFSGSVPFDLIGSGLSGPFQRDR